MSLIMALETYEGIVMTADRLSTISYYNEWTKTTDAFPKTYNAHKLFLMENGYGISYCGNGILNDNILVEQFISEVICTKHYNDNEPINVAEEIMNSFRSFNTDTILLLCGYYNLKSFIIEINCKLNGPYVYSDNVRRGAVIRYGDMDIANAVLGVNTENSKTKFHYGYPTYRLQDAIDLLVFTNLTTAKYQQFQEV